MRPWKVVRTGTLACDWQPQWGHGLEAVESVGAWRWDGLDLVPQWGHGLEAVESYRGLRALPRRLRAAMGPRP